MNCSISRRGFAASLATSLLAASQTRTSGFAYAGCYTPNGAGIYLFRVFSAGDLQQVKVFPSASPSWLAIHPSRRYLYAANEVPTFNGRPTGAVSAFSINASSGDLVLLNTVSSHGAGPAHLSVDPSGQFTLVANYGGGNVAVLAIQPDGSLGDATDVQSCVAACRPNPCPIGARQALAGPPGNFAISGHDASHAHMIATDPQGAFAIANDVGLDLTIVWRFDRRTGRLVDPKTYRSSPGAGPRHFAFHPNGRWFYSLNEESSTLAFFRYDPATGVLEPALETTTLPRGFAGTNFTSEIAVSPNGRFLYAANRLHDTIAIFRIDPASGKPFWNGEEWTRGDYPRSFTIDPSGRFLYVANHRSDAITTFRVGGNGALRFTGAYTPVGSPAMLVFG